MHGRVQVPLRGRVRHGEGVQPGAAARAEARPRHDGRRPQGERLPQAVREGLRRELRDPDVADHGEPGGVRATLHQAPAQDARAGGGVRRLAPRARPPLPARAGEAGSRRRALSASVIARFAAAFGLFLSLAVAAPGRAAAQGAPVDTAAVLLDLAGKLETEGRLEAARMLYRLILERYPSAAAAGEARLRLGFVDRRIDVARAEQSGRTELLVWSTLYGLWLGVAVPAAFGADDAEMYGIGLLVGGPSAFAVARGYARRHPLSVGQARAITFGGTWGTWQGFGLREVIDIGTDTETVCFTGGCVEVETDEREAAFAAAVLGGLAGIGIGAAL